MGVTGVEEAGAGGLASAFHCRFLLRSRLPYARYNTVHFACNLHWEDLHWFQEGMKGFTVEVRTQPSLEERRSEGEESTMDRKVGGDVKGEK